MLSCFGLLVLADLNVLAQWKVLTEGQRVNHFRMHKGQVYCGELGCGAEPISVDTETFRVWEDTDYAKDKNNVYYPIKLVCIDYEKCGVCYCDTFIILEANPATFTYLGHDYSTDGDRVYFRGENIKKADAATFKVFDGAEFMFFATDKNNVYMHNKVFEAADPRTFVYDSTHPLNDSLIHQTVVRDRESVWIYNPPYSLKRIE